MQNIAKYSRICGYIHGQRPPRADELGREINPNKWYTKYEVVKMAYIITLTTSRYSPTDSGKSWKSKPFGVETETITKEHYRNHTSDDTLRFFRRLGGSETITRNYTAMGYVPVKLVSISPARDEKIVREFNIRWEVTK